jgi:hypothetical protein
MKHGKIHNPHTLYCLLQPCLLSSTISLTAHSFSPSMVTTGPGQFNFQLGNKLSSFGVCQCSCEAWNLRNIFGWLGSSSVYSETPGRAPVIVYESLNRGMNLATGPVFPFLYSHLLLKVLSITVLPTLNTSSSDLDLFAWYACRSLAHNKLSFTSLTSSWSCSRTPIIFITTSSRSGCSSVTRFASQLGITLSILPICNSKPV